VILIRDRNHHRLDLMDELNKDFILNYTFVKDQRETRIINNEVTKRTIDYSISNFDKRLIKENQVRK
jgi:hypothetical protein